MTTSPDPNVTADVPANSAEPGQTESFDPDGLSRTTDNITGSHSAAVGLGTVIANRYSLVEQIGEGGMGSVYLARQTEPVKRQVALKLIKAGTDSRQVLNRFEAERQALALMDHPNIARIYDGGVTPTGQPFFVMELVPGLPITKFCDERRLDIRARLELFVAVCQAVQHAHQKGIIHRDLKPGNVLVTEIDGRPTPKVIDFGVAKATEQKLTEASIADLGLIVGTPAYMSPEQADTSTTDIDTRTDVYALGVILYELLVGSPPFDARHFQRGAILEILRMVREDEPPRPSTKLSSSDALPNIAANRNIEPAKLTRSLRGELDWVVMKALEKDRARRYDSATGFAHDIQRFLNNEVVEARPPSVGYRLSKFLRRNKATVTAATLLFLAILGGMVGTTWGMLRAQDAETLAKDRLLDVTKERDQKEAARKDAMSMVEFLASVFQSATPERNGRTITVAETLDKAVKKLDMDLAPPPPLRASLKFELAVAYCALGLPNEAIPLLENVRDYYRETLNPEDPKRLLVINYLSAAYYDAGRRSEGLNLAEECLALNRKVNGAEHRYTIRAMITLASANLARGHRDEAMAMQLEALALSRKVNGPEHGDTLTAMNDLAQSYYAAGKREEALKLQEEVVALHRKTHGSDHLETLRALYNLAATYLELGRRSEALKHLEDIVPQFRLRLGPEHNQTLIALQRLATAYDAVGRQEDALKMREEILATRRKASGPEHPSTLVAMNNLAASYLAAARRDEAQNLWEEVLRLRQKLSGPEHPETLVTMNNLSAAYSELGRAAEALKLREALVPLKRKVVGPEHPETIAALFALATSYNETGRWDQAIALLNETLPIARKRFGANNMYHGLILAVMGSAELKSGAFDKAEPHLREGMANLEKTAPTNLTLQYCRSDLGKVLFQRKEYAEGEKLLLASFAAMKQREKLIPPNRSFRLPEVIDRLIDLYSATNKPDEVKKWRQERANFSTVDPPTTKNK